jgi:uncharacterized protein YjbI with pentapeptide repeats
MSTEETRAMPNPEHLQILQQGVEAWNQSRHHQPGDGRPDLHGADLHGADLRSADLMGTDLMGADLHEADLRRADLTGANLTGANLTGAKLGRVRLHCALLHGTDLRRTNLIGTDFMAADLHGADLRRADLFRTDFSHADLWDADLTEVRLHETLFIDSDLYAVQGLETCRHSGPSTLGHRTLARSGSLPLVFLRGCGLPEALIDYLPSLLNEPFQFYSCFISYASRDHAFVERLYADLQDKGVRCFYAPEDMKIGDRLRPRIDETIRTFDKVLLVLSKASMASQWVEQEVETALARECQQRTTVLFPVRIDNTVMAIETGWPTLIRNTRNIGDFRRWKTYDVYQKAFDRLLQDLKAAETRL